MADNISANRCRTIITEVVEPRDACGRYTMQMFRWSVRLTKKEHVDYRQGQGQGGLSIEEEQEAEEEEEVLEEKEEKRSRRRRKNGRALVYEQKKNEKVSVLRPVVRKVGRWGR